MSMAEKKVGVLVIGGGPAGLAAGIFHQKLLTIRDLKEYLNANGVEMRL